MSSHSQSSSEIEQPPYYDIMQVYFKAFNDDFSFADVQEYVKHLFFKTEYQSIISEQDDHRQLLQLFSILQSKKDIIPNFLQLIKRDYGFICDAIEKELNNMSKMTAQYLEKVHILRSKNPKHTDFNVLRMDMYIKLCGFLRKLKRYHGVVLLGDFGTGKKWLALNVCYDFELMIAMDFQIYWLDLSDCTSPEQDLNRLQTLLLLLNGSRSSPSPTFSNAAVNNGFRPINHDYSESIFHRKLELQQILRKKLSSPEHQNCLVILQDVQNVKAYETFNLGCKLLIITRNLKVSESLSKEMSTQLKIDPGLTESEFYTLFEKYLGQSRDNFPKNAVDLYTYSMGHPYLLSITAQNLSKNKTNWDNWICTFKNSKIQNEKISKAVEISLNVLSEDLLKLYATLVIFPHSVPIPTKLLAALWNKSLQETENIVHRFYKYSFVIIDQTNLDCKIPLIYSSHLRTSTRMRQLINSEKELHIKVIEYYKIDQNIKLIDLCDIYFYTCIGIHLRGSGNNELFPIIYMDLGFIEKKMRTVGLSNTIRDLKYFEKEIIDNDRHRINLLHELREFLPKVEEKLSESKDTSLLQYALMGTGLVYNEAQRQISQYPQRVWFHERGSFHKRRQIVKLMHQAKGIHFLNQDLCLIVLTDNNMLLLNISLDYSTDPILLQNDDLKKIYDITEARIFRDGNFVITLDIGGGLKIWSITNNYTFTPVHRQSSKQRANPPNFLNSHRLKSKKCKQRIQQNFKGQHDVIVAFYIEEIEKSVEKDTKLHIAFRNGNIAVYKWNNRNEEFVLDQIPILETKSHDILFLTKILQTYYMILSKSGSIEFWNLRDSSKAYVPFEWPKLNSGPLSYELYKFSKSNIVFTRALFVFSNMVLSITFEHKVFSARPDGNVEVLCENFKNDITCAKLSDDQRYLILGTKRALIVYDINVKSEVLRSNVTDSISCLDIFPLTDKIFKYIIICGAQHRKVLNIFAIRMSGENGITWAHNITSMGNDTSNNPQLEADVWLLGQKLYDIDYKEDNSTLLMAVDSKNRVHQVTSTNTKSWQIITPREISEAITSITIGKELAFVGYNNGYIFNITSDSFEKNLFNKSVLYLKLIDDNHLIASTDKETLIYKVGTTDDLMKSFPFDTKHSYKVMEKYVLFVSEKGLFTLIEVKTDQYEQMFQKDGFRSFQGNITKLRSCDYKNNLLCLTTESLIKIYSFHYDSRKNTISLCDEENQIDMTDYKNPKKKISCTALANDATLIAVGYTTGDLEVYKVEEKKLEHIYHLQSHHSHIYDMIFSPDNEVLVSCAEQLCFWNIQYTLNNPQITNITKRSSSRFSSQRSSEFYDHLINGHRPKVRESVWTNKQGPPDKPELFACIKFDGSKAERVFANNDFTQFNTIDDEGVYYHLSLYDIPDKTPEKIKTITQGNKIDIINGEDINELNHFSNTNESSLINENL